MNELEKEKLLQKCQDMFAEQKEIFNNPDVDAYGKAAIKCYVCLEMINVLEGKKTLEQAFNDLMRR